jgi:hypothetical protein
MNGLKMIGLAMILLVAGSCAVVPALWIAGDIALQHNSGTRFDLPQESNENRATARAAQT